MTEGGRGGKVKIVGDGQMREENEGRMREGRIRAGVTETKEE